MHIKLILKFIFISLLVLSLSGCGHTEECEPGTDQTEKESITVATWKDFGVDLSETKIAHLIGNTYYMASWEWDLENMLKKNTRIDRTSMWGEGVQNPETLVELDNGQQLITFLADVQGAVYLLYREESGEKMSYFLRKVDAGGESVYCEELPGAQEEYGDLEAVSGGIVGPQGEVCLMGRFGNIYLFDSQGILTHKAASGWAESDTEQNTGFVNAGADICLYQILDGKVSLRTLDMKTGDTGPVISLDLGVGREVRLFSGYERGILCSDSDTLWEYSLETGEMRELASWQDKNINIQGNFVEHIGIQDGEIFVLYYDVFTNTTHQVLIQEKGKDEVTRDDNVIVIGCLDLFASDARASAQKFNRSNTEYRVEVKTYSLKEDGYYGFYEELLRGEGPDIVDVSWLPKDMLAAKGIWEDLTYLFQESEVVQEADLLPCIQKAGMSGDRIMYIIPEFYLMGNMVEKGYVKDGGWTSEDFLALAERYPDSSLTNYHSASVVLTNTMSAEMGSFIDWEKKECYFQSDSFINLLELIKKNFKVYNGNAWEDIAEKFAEKEILVFGVNVSSILDYLENKYAFQETADLAGYPNPEGKPWYRMLMNQVYAINSASQQKEGAWRFMEFLLSEEYQSIHTKKFPVRVDAFEALLDKKVVFNENDVFHNMYLNTQVKASELPEFEEADREFLRFMADHAYWEESVSVQEVSSILYEELEPFFQGDKSAEETAEIIQNRISLYLQE